jgi:hypothetical protein
MATKDREEARKRLDLLLSPPVEDTPEPEVVAEEPAQPDPQETTRKLLEQIVELAKRPFDISGMAAPQVTVQVPEGPTPNITIEAPQAAHVVPWTFEFERFPNGSLKAIHATPRISK